MMLPERIAVLRAIAEVARRQKAQVAPLFLEESLDEIDRLKRIIAAQDRINKERVTITPLGREVLRLAK